MECQAWNRAPAFCTHQQEGSQVPHRPSAHHEPWEQKAVSLARWPKSRPRDWEMDRLFSKVMAFFAKQKPQVSTGSGP